MSESMRAILDRGIGQMLGAAGHRVMHWRDNVDTPETRLQTWRDRFCERVSAEEADRRAYFGAKVKRGWWLRFRGAKVSNVVAIRRSA